ncbi:MAG: hypothetical protein FJ347_04015 [Sphingomonadales bacterium]|nr:hypothetical protein [Sphingomonadales bacterium]
MSEAILYIPASNARIAYAAAEIFRHSSECQILITEDEDAYLNSKATVKLHYTNKGLAGRRIYRSGFLDQTGIRQGFVPSTARIDGVFCLFPDENHQEYDLLAMVFWCLTRYEEYQTFTPDQHGRFPASASLLHKLEVLEEPVCDIAINNQFAQWGLSAKKEFRIIPTLDIDIAFAFAGRGLLRALGAALKTPFSLPQRLKSIADPITDPNYSFPYIQTSLKNHPEARLFWHCGAKSNIYDKQVRLSYRPLTEAIQNLDKHISCGLHPSFAASGNAEILLQEKQYLENTLNREVTDSRMHYILLSMPHTYRMLRHCGIKDDYSMGYPDAIGFRAGTAYSFAWYNLIEEQATNLHIYPFCIMEATCKHYLNQTTEQAISKGNQLKSVIRESGGNFCFIFHNESLGKQKIWQGWNSVFEAWLA